MVKKQEALLLNGHYTSGTYSINFSGSELKSGVVFYTMNFTEITSVIQRQ
ncbi:MAG: hypothetical protein IPI04_15890 [Ignavibacteria bacterium]|nr:hypothetical protein [Ignavibacteria bacterium]